MGKASEKQVAEAAAKVDLDALIVGGNPLPGSGIDDADLVGGQPLDPAALKLKVARHRLEAE